MRVPRNEGSSRPRFLREPCSVGREAAAEASVAVHAGRDIERRKSGSSERRDGQARRRQHRLHREMARCRGASRRLRPHARMNALHRDLGDLHSAPAVEPVPQREGEPKPEMNGVKKSDGAILPSKQANKGTEFSRHIPEFAGPAIHDSFASYPIEVRKRFCRRRTPVVCATLQRSVGIFRNKVSPCVGPSSLPHYCSKWRRSEVTLRPLGSVLGRDGAVYECGVLSDSGKDWLVVVTETGPGTHAAESAVTHAMSQLQTAQQDALDARYQRIADMLVV